jgi:hypothetical protein
LQLTTHPLFAPARQAANSGLTLRRNQITKDASSFSVSEELPDLLRVSTGAKAGVVFSFGASDSNSLSND